MSSIFLYIKHHKVTNLNYFGKTYRKDVESYRGSGKYWSWHLRKHGNKVDTLCVWEFDNQEECTTFALKFSFENDIINSDKWANLQFENGIDGSPPGTLLSEDHKHKIGKGNKGKKRTPESRKRISEGKTGKKVSEETKRILSEVKKGEKNHFFGKHHTEESKELLSQLRKGNHNSIDTEFKKGTHLGEENTFFGKNHTDESKQRVSETKRNKNPIPDDFEEQLSNLQRIPLLQIHYNVGYKLIRRWKEELLKDKQNQKHYLLYNKPYEFQM